MSFARVRALVVIGVLAVAAVVFVVVALVRDTPGRRRRQRGCPAGAPRANIELPGRPGRGQDQGLQRHQRRPARPTRSPRTSRTAVSRCRSPAESKTKFERTSPWIRYGPKTVGDAQLLRAYFLGQAKTQYNAKRTDDVVDIVIGNDVQAARHQHRGQPVAGRAGRAGAAAGRLPAAGAEAPTEAS